jgi:RNA polymerase sigma-70 factor, ECF subfamily
MNEEGATTVKAGAREEGEARLVQGLRSASPAAQAELYDRFAGKLQRFAVSLLPQDKSVAEDVVVETMIDAARDIKRFNPHKAAFSAWLYGIARRRIQQELRRRRRLKSVPAEAQIGLEDLSSLSDGRDLAQSAAARLDAQHQLIALAEILSPLEMEILILDCIDELSLKEIGAVIGRSERAVHSLLHRAKQKARERMRTDED